MMLTQTIETETLATFAFVLNCYYISENTQKAYLKILNEF